MGANRVKGFTLVEVLITLALVTFLSMLAMQMIAPWMLFKAKMDTERKMLDVTQALTEVYKRNPLRIDQDAQARLVLDQGIFPSSLPSAVAGGGVVCENNTGFDLIRNYISSGANDAQKDGFGSPFCVFVSEQLSRPVDGTTLFYHNIAVLSPGADGVVTSAFDPVTGSLTVRDDDMGTLIDGFAVQSGLYSKTLARLEKVADLYGTYFSSRFLANPGRDVSVNYFSQTWDTTGSVPSTAGVPQPVAQLLSPLGLNDVDSRSPYEDLGALGAGRTNDIFVDNHNLCIPLTAAANCPAGSVGSTSCLCVRSPASNAIPPYTAIVYAVMPGGSLLSKTIVGHY